MYPPVNCPFSPSVFDNIPQGSDPPQAFDRHSAGEQRWVCEGVFVVASDVLEPVHYSRREVPCLSELNFVNVVEEVDVVDLVEGVPNHGLVDGLVEVVWRAETEPHVVDVEHQGLGESQVVCKPKSAFPCL